MVQCSKCSRDAVTFIRYNGTHLCSPHFQEYVEKRVKRELREQVDLDKVKDIGVAVSGGKDSCVALVLMHDILGDRRDVHLRCITVDEGIAGYRPATIEKVRQLCHRLDIEHTVVSFQQEVGTDMDRASTALGHRTPCAYCGVFRRRCLNKAAKALGAQALATGHNLDDITQAIMMNFTRGDTERLARMGPHAKVQPGLIPRITPLRQIPEKETYLYALVRGIDFSDLTCPYWEAALRNQYRDMIDKMEARSPGTKFSILSSYDTIRPMLQERFPPSQLTSCECGEPSPGGQCMACAMAEELNKRKK